MEKVALLMAGLGALLGRGIGSNAAESYFNPSIDANQIAKRIHESGVIRGHWDHGVPEHLQSMINDVTSMIDTLGPNDLPGLTRSALHNRRQLNEFLAADQGKELESYLRTIKSRKAFYEDALKTNTNIGAPQRDAIRRLLDNHDTMLSMLQHSRKGFVDPNALKNVAKATGMSHGDMARTQTLSGSPSRAILRDLTQGAAANAQQQSVKNVRRLGAGVGALAGGALVHMLTKKRRD